MSSKLNKDKEKWQFRKNATGKYSIKDQSYSLRIKNISLQKLQHYHIEKKKIEKQSYRKQQPQQQKKYEEIIETIS